MITGDRPAWTFEHSVHAHVAPEEAWAFWTDVSNWTFDTSLESVTLDGPFAAGTRGVTRPRGGDAIAWLIREAGSGHACIEIQLPGASVEFYWTFAAADGGTQITQRVNLWGPGADLYIDVAATQLANGIPEGMRKLSEAMEHD